MNNWSETHLTHFKSEFRKMGKINWFINFNLLFLIIALVKGSSAITDDQYLAIVLSEESDVDEDNSSYTAVTSAELNYPLGSTFKYFVVAETSTRSPVRKRFSTATPTMDIITVVWYVATLVVLISFFVVMACADTSKCLAPKPPDEETPVPPTPAPSYRLFAPPSYESVIQKSLDSIYIIPVHSSMSSQTSSQSTRHLVTNLQGVMDHINESGSARSEPENFTWCVTNSENRLSVTNINSSLCIVNG
ncbi:uncharacterized protein LOC131438431 isoform X2 [Malaya genurostris]|uniref:uncharacterized protein LOC131438431 isoform X2 n=1 Tax=Malaya genurostris TaxID=325434 RepID=UPI0026F3E3D8|nr:uncharacterized protein LOC131438431 isoform X2 [Malaya genurostris]